jgi:YD repeat-containing protein
MIARLVDDPNNPGYTLTQAYQYEYNNQDHITQFIDPAGRQTAFDYYTNGVDLYRVRQTNGVANDILAEFGIYNSQHCPSNYIDAARMTYSLSWNSAGQLSQVTNPKSEITQLNYDSDNYLRSVVRSKSGLAATNSFGYDFYGRLNAVTNPENYYITCQYDNLDRPTNITYADGSFEKYVYNRLDLFLAYDRAGSRTVYQYDNTERPISIKDRLNQVTYFDWCGCGSLASITDPLGHVTAWNRDLEGRVTQKTYDNTKTVQYAYEVNTTRVKSITDAESQVKNFAYNVDDTISNITYTGAVISTPSVTFFYDANYSRLTAMIDGTGTNTFTYNPVTGSASPGAGQFANN